MSNMGNPIERTATNFGVEMRKLYVRQLISVMAFAALGSSEAAPLPFDLRMGMPLDEISKKIILTPYETTPNLYMASHIQNGPANFQTFFFLITPEHGLCKITAATGDVQGSNKQIEMDIFRPREVELSDMFGSGTQYGWLSLPEGRFAMTKWERGNATLDEPTGIFLEGVGNGKTGYVTLSYQSKNLDECIAWNKSHRDLEHWKIERVSFLSRYKKPEALAVTVPAITPSQPVGRESNTPSVTNEKAIPPTQENVKASVTVAENIPNIPTGYKGDSIVELIKKFDAVDKATEDEFTKKSSVREMLDKLRLKRTYRFVFDNSLNFDSTTKYDADSEIFQIKIIGNILWFTSNARASTSVFDAPKFTSLTLTEKSSTNSYVGTNSFGASAKITERHVETYGVALNGWNGVEVLLLSLPIKPHDAKTLKSDLAYYIDVELAESDRFKGNVLNYLIGGEKPTITNPTSTSISSKYLFANVKTIGVFRKKTGVVIGRKKFD